MLFFHSTDDEKNFSRPAKRKTKAHTQEVKVKNATEKELEKIVGLSKARIIKQYFINLS